MKYLIILLAILGAGWYLYNLGATNSQIKNAKQNMGVIENNEKKDDSKEIINEIVEKKDNTKPTYGVKKLDNKNYIEIDDLNEKVENISDNIEITGKVLNKDVDKIVVDFSNKNSDFANDSYKLKTFKKGDSSFKYNADSLSFQNLDYGENKYLIKAYVGDDISELELIINIPENLGEEEIKDKKLDSKVSYDKKLIGEGDDSLFIGLPQSELFGKPLSLDSGKITYSNISDLEILKDNFDKTEITSDNIWNSEGTGYINKNMSGYVYWNTFREIDYDNKDAGVSFYVLKKVGDKLIYEKMYFDFNHNLLGTIKIKEFDVDPDKNISAQMSELNTELKTQNKDFEEVKKADKLFREIVR